MISRQLSAKRATLAVSTGWVLASVLLCASFPLWSAFPVVDYLPLPDGATWVYNNGFSADVVSGETTINGVPTKELLGDDGNSEFFSNDSNGIRIHRIGLSLFSANTTFQPPIPLANAQANVGDRIISSGIAEFSVPGAGTFVLSYSSTATIAAAERITVPYGVFDTIRLAWTYTLVGNVQGTPINETGTSTLWLAPGIGIAKDDEQQLGVLELVSTNVESLLSTTLVASVLPSSRSAEVGVTATAFASIINTDTAAGTNCFIAPVTSVPAEFHFQTTDPATNALIGTPDTPVAIAAGALQSFLIAFTPTAPFGPTDIQLSFDCANTNPAQIVTGLNTLLLSASSTPVPDIVALAATPTDDGVVSLPGTLGANAFAAATVNVGAVGDITATVDTGSAALPVNLFICESNPVTGECLSAPATSTTRTINAGATPTFTIFVNGNGLVPFDPANNRIFVRFKDAGDVTRGSTSVAVRTLQ